MRRDVLKKTRRRDKGGNKKGYRRESRRYKTIGVAQNKKVQKEMIEEISRGVEEEEEGSLY